MEQEKCEKVPYQKTTFSYFRKRWNMYFDYQDKLLVCTIDKVMSTTFLAHFKKLALKRKPNFIKLETSRDDTRDIFYGIDKGLQFCIIL